MTDPLSARAASTSVRAYRFAGVEFDLRRQALTVDGVEVAVKPLTLRLLRLLCEANGRLLTRDELFESLWPGGQEISDAALSQHIWRLRSALGPHADLIATVRRSGVRLEAAVAVEHEPLPAATATESAVTQTPPSPRAPRRRAGLLVLAIVAAVLAALLVWRRDPLVSDGYALRVSDLQASRADTPAQIASALAAGLGGDRARAAAILRSVHESDARTPVPALMLGWWSAGDDPAQARRWIDEANARFTPQATPYLRLFADYIGARTLQQPIAGQVDALLEQRPSAWLLQHTRSHVALARRDFATALRALRAVPFDIPDATLLADVLADRVSLGDGEAQTAARGVVAVWDDAVLGPYLRARFAWSRGDPAQAVAQYAQCARAAAERQANDNRLECARHAALAAADAGSDDAVRLADAAARLSHELGFFVQEADQWGLEAFLTARAGHADAARDALGLAWTRAATPLARAPLLLIALENGLPPPGDLAPVADALPVEPTFGGVRQLLLAWQAWARGDRAEAARQLGLARERGVAGTWHAEDAALLAARLGESPPPCRLDPPYPNPLRLTACIALRDLETQSKQ